MRMSESAKAGPDVRLTVRILAALCVALAVMGAGLAAMYARAARENACWRAAYEEDRLAPERACGG